MPPLWGPTTDKEDLSHGSLTPQRVIQSSLQTVLPALEEPLASNAPALKGASFSLSAALYSWPQNVCVDAEFRTSTVFFPRRQNFNEALQESVQSKLEQSDQGSRQFVKGSSLGEGPHAVIGGSGRRSASLPGLLS